MWTCWWLCVWAGVSKVPLPIKWTLLVILGKFAVLSLVFPVQSTWRVEVKAVPPHCIAWHYQPCVAEFDETSVNLGKRPFVPYYQVDQDSRHCHKTLTLWCTLPIMDRMSRIPHGLLFDSFIGSLVLSYTGPVAISRLYMAALYLFGNRKSIVVRVVYSTNHPLALVEIRHRG